MIMFNDSNYYLDDYCQNDYSQNDYCSNDYCITVADIIEVFIEDVIAEVKFTCVVIN